MGWAQWKDFLDDRQASERIRKKSAEGGVVPAVKSLQQTTSASTPMLALENAAAVYLRFLALTADVGAAVANGGVKPHVALEGGGSDHSDDAAWRTAAARYLRYRDAAAESPTLHMAHPPRDVAFMWATDLLNRAPPPEMMDAATIPGTTTATTSATTARVGLAEFIRVASELSLLFSQPVPIQASGSRSAFEVPLHRDRGLVALMSTPALVALLIGVAPAHYVLPTLSFMLVLFWISRFSPNTIRISGALATPPLRPFADLKSLGFVVTKKAWDKK
jgi:hypothetical protein